MPHIPQVLNPTKPRFDGTIDDFREQHASDNAVQARLRNKVKECSTCGKPCAYTLSNCNSCGDSLESLELSYCDNIFMAFVHGISRGKFPYKLSLRAQTPEYLCFDDPLSLSPLHFNAIPTAVYIADFRYLFTDPRRGLELVEKLFAVCAEAALSQFWSNSAFRKVFFANEDVPKSAEALMETTCCGMNFPPSMYQLHLQFIHAPLLPFHYALVKEYNHFHHGRFFPLNFLRKALACGERARMAVSEDTAIQEVIEKMKGLGVCYDEEHRAFMNKLETLQRRFAPWHEDDFRCLVVNGCALDAESGESSPSIDTTKMQAEDTAALQSYGRPYQEDGTPSGSYYMYAKQAHDVVNFVLASKM